LKYTPFLFLKDGLNIPEILLIKFLILLFILLLIVLAKRQQWSKLFLIISILSLTNLRNFELEKIHYDGFHMLIWVGLLIALSFYLIQGKWWFVGFFPIILLLFINRQGIFVSPNHIQDFEIYYSRIFNMGEAIRQTKNEQDKLLAMPDFVLGYWQGDIKPQGRFIFFYKWMTSVNQLKPVGTTYDQALQKENALYNTPRTIVPSASQYEAPATPSTGYMPTAGDMTSLFGNLISTFGPMENTKANRAGDTPNVNAFQNFGQDAIKTNEDILGLVKGQAANAATRLRRNAVATKRSARGTSRSINTQRAMDTLIDLETNAQELGVDDNLSQQMMSILGNKASLQNTKDQVVMTGEQQRDLADRQDRDNFYTQMGQDIATKGQGVQTIGKDLNAMSENQMYMKMLNQMSKYFQFDSQGNIIGINQAKK